MKIIDIRNLANERKQAVDAVKAQMDSIKTDRTLADEYKHEQLKQLDEQLKTVRNQYEPVIDEKLASYELEKKKALNKAEYEGLSDRDINIQLLQEMRNQKLTASLVNQHSNNNDARAELMDGLKSAVKTNDNRAGAYLQAIKDLNIYGVGLTELENEYRSQNLNDAQKSVQHDLEVMNEIKAEYTKDVKGDPFQNRLEKYK